MFSVDNKKLLKKIDKRARGYFQRYFKDVEFKKRLLNQEGDEEMTFYENKLAQIKMQKEFKSIAYQTLHMEGIKNNEDIQFLKKELVKDVFSVDNIEWQVKKHSVLKKFRTKNR
jgi:hypothetical protein